ncbi:hypothetical protein BCU00_010645 [Vibrio breoganii]|uniref:Spore coat protein U domain-containing protein n=1 Tax=Vibrio breoganii TaxID=553239 RepID=A0AAN1CTV7_9VIBR|nr:hypothetical protein [Vibrio breoganii]ANO34882.1 hypothetical protein A6E01_16985 [Vibrio breoganii]PMK40892.1 hypothetical protein BCU00_15080 [Vibrio breoganii]PMM46262.1 hypothetical protein BCT52_07600 [Vibrio breoganii]
MIRIVALALVLLFCGTAVAKTCEGRWSVKVENSNVSLVGEKARIPVFIQTSQSIRECAPQGVYIRSTVNEGVQLQSSNALLKGWVSDSSGARTGLRTNKGVIYPLSLGEQTKLWLEVPNAVSGVPGLYASQLTFSIVGIDGIKSIVERAQLKVTPFVELKVNGQGAKRTVVNFGTLKTNQTKTLNLHFRSNTNVGLIFNAEYEKLKHKKLQGEYVSYQLYLNNKKLDFDTLMFLPRIHQGNSTNKLLKIRIGDTTQARAGSYSDTVTITATARP